MAGGVDAWEGERVRRWLESSAGIERQLAPVADALFEVAALAEGERVLDVGCGTGPTTHRAASLVGADGAVTGLDVSVDMLAAAAAADAGSPGRAPIEWVVADAATWEPPTRGFDVVLSRFGVMFFDDPAAAFGNLAAVTRPGGRMAVAVWAHRHRNPVFEVPLAAALATRVRLALPAVEVPRPDEGAFSLADPDHVRALLGEAGWGDVGLDERTLPLPLGGGLGPDDAAAATCGQGPTRVVTEDLDAEALSVTVAAVADALRPHVVDGHVVLDADIVIVTATRA